MGKILQFADGLMNAITGGGTSADKRMYQGYVNVTVDPQQIAAAYRSSWLMRKIVDVPAEDMTREWRDWKTDKNTIEQIDAVERKFGIRAKVRHALQLGRLGGGAIVIGIANDEPSKPLDPAKGRALAYVHVVTRHQLLLGDEETDPLSPEFGQPRYFELRSKGGHTNGVRIHPSRIVAFQGAAVPDMGVATWEDRFWGDSVYQSVGEAIRNADSAQGGFASLIDEASYDIIGIPGLSQLAMEPSGEKRITKRLEVVRLGKSIHRAVIRDAAETWEARQVNWAGMPDILKTYLAVVAGAADIPATRLLGKSPDGMNATGDGDERNYFANIGSAQEHKLRPALDRLDAVLFAHAGIAGEGLWYDFAPLREMSETEIAEIAFKKAQTSKIYVDTALVPFDALAKAVQNTLNEDGTYPGLADAIDDLGDDPGVSEADLALLAGNDRGANVVPMRRAANDAAPRTLYVSRPVLNRAELQSWATAQGLGELQPDLHVTIVHSKTPLDWMKVDSEDWNQEKDGTIDVPPGGVRIVEPLGDRTAVLLFTSSRLSWRHQQILNAGAQSDYPDYQPHVSLTGEPVDLLGVEPYRGVIKLGPERFEEVVEGGA